MLQPLWLKIGTHIVCNIYIISKVRANGFCSALHCFVAELSYARITIAKMWASAETRAYLRAGANGAKSRKLTSFGTNLGCITCKQYIYIAWRHAYQFSESESSVAMDYRNNVALELEIDSTACRPQGVSI